MVENWLPQMFANAKMIVCMHNANIDGASDVQCSLIIIFASVPNWKFEIWQRQIMRKKKGQRKRLSERKSDSEILPLLRAVSLIEFSFHIFLL